jgi:hypothetical protein
MVKAIRTEQGAINSRNTSKSRDLKVADGSKNICNSSVDCSRRDNNNIDSNIDLDYIFFELLAQAEKPKTAETSAIAETPAIFKFRIEIYIKTFKTSGFWPRVGPMHFAHPSY